MLIKTMLKQHTAYNIPSPVKTQPHGKAICDWCWTGYPEPCLCGGSIHNEFELMFDDDTILNYECTTCGEAWEFRR